MGTISKHHSNATAPARSAEPKRRYYPREQKLKIVEESFAADASVSVAAAGTT